MSHIVNNVNIKSFTACATPDFIKSKFPLSEENENKIFEYRSTIQSILDGTDKRKFVVVGPCSIHDPEAALDYAKKLKVLADEVSNDFVLIMRVYFEKPRTTVGWKGLINDPHLNDSFDINTGLEIARKLMIDITEIGLPIATEALDPFTPQYLADLVSWSAIGARTTESQTHREMASGLSSPIGFKNGTDGNIQVAINGILSSAEPHAFLGMDDNGVVSIVQTSGNKYGHVILRGGSNGTNYDSVAINQVEKELEKAKLPMNIVIDCSHGNSNKNHNLQPLVFKNGMNQILEGNTSIKGFMIESNIFEGNQKLSNPQELKYGVSITDACISFEETVKLFKK